MRRSADNVRSQLERIMVKLDLDLVSVDYSDPNHFHYIARTIVSGYFMQAAYADRGKGRHWELGIATIQWDGYFYAGSAFPVHLTGFFVFVTQLLT